MNNKEIVNKHWKDFEKLAFNLVKEYLSFSNTVYEELTKSQKDGGYDAEILIASNSGVSRVLMEAKLRSDVTSDLPLQGFAKAIIIAVVKQTDMIYIVSNLHFSQKTIMLLEKYSDNASIGIDLINGASILNYLNRYNSDLEGISKELISFLRKNIDVSSEQQLHSMYNKSYYYNLNNTITPCLPKADNPFYELLNSSGIIIVSGMMGCGKSYFIDKYFDEIKECGVNAQTLDLSRFMTYREFYLALLEKMFGLTIELFDIAGEELFDNAFSRIMDFKSHIDIDILKFIYSRISSTEYDYSVIFTLLAKLYKQIDSNSNKLKRKIVAFKNIIYASNEVLQLLCFLINNGCINTCVLEISDDDYCSSVTKDKWSFIKHGLYESAQGNNIKIDNWTKKDAINCLKKNFVGLSIHQLTKIIQLYGTQPKDIYNLIDLVKSTYIYEHIPQELVFQKILELNTRKNEELYEKYFCGLIFEDSSILKMYAFMYLLNTNVEIGFLKNYINNDQVVEKWIFEISRNQLFCVEESRITVISQKVEQCFNGFCEKILSAYVVSPIIDYIYCNYGELHLSSEEELETKCKMHYFGDKTKYVESLVELANEFVELSQLKTALLYYSKAKKLLSSNIISTDFIVSLNINIGLLEARIWELGEYDDEMLAIINEIDWQISNSPKLIRVELYNKLALKFYTLKYQYFHFKGSNNEALKAATDGINWVKRNSLYNKEKELSGKIWRFYAIAVKEKYNDIYRCIDAFKQGETHLKDSAKFLFGSIIHNNMVVDDSNIEKRLQIKINNYKPLYNLEHKLSIDEYLHFRVNVAALKFLMKDYQEAEKEYIELLNKSNSFCITRETMRILNDMANICWINGDINEARRKYYSAWETAKINGNVINNFAILINLVSFEIFENNFNQALLFHKELLPYLIQKYQSVSKGKYGFENNNYYNAACVIHLKNLLVLYNKLKTERTNILYDINKILRINSKSEIENCSRSDLFNIIDNLSLKNTEYEHGSLYLIKN